MKMNEDISVSILCVAYNQESYIRQCLDSLLMQKTNFGFEILVHDDASTDGTQLIIKEYELRYPDIIKPIYQVENQYSKGISPTLQYNLPRAKGKYVATEGIFPSCAGEGAAGGQGARGRNRKECRTFPMDHQKELSAGHQIP